MDRVPQLFDRPLKTPPRKGPAVLEFDEVLTTTRAVRRRLDLDRPVEPAVITECLRLAAQAPTGGNVQSWRFVVVTDPELRSGVAEYYRKGAQDYLAAGVARAKTDAQRRVAQSSVHLMENLHRVPVHVIPCMKGRPPEGNQAGYYGSILPAVWSFALALRSRGLGSVWTTLHLAHETEVAELLGIPHDRHPGRVVAGCLHHRHRVPAGVAAADRALHLLEPVRGDRCAGGGRGLGVVTAPPTTDPTVAAPNAV